MCANLKDKEALKKKIEQEQKELENAVQEGDKNLCEMIQFFVQKHLKGLHLISSDGKN